eukprot:3719860-Prymnesium_polylepis.1
MAASDGSVRYGTREATAIKQRRRSQPVWTERRTSISTPGIEETVARFSMVPDGHPPSPLSSPVPAVVRPPPMVQLVSSATSRTPPRGAFEFRRHTSAVHV